MNGDICDQMRVRRYTVAHVGIDFIRNQSRLVSPAGDPSPFSLRSMGTSPSPKLRGSRRKTWPLAYLVRKCEPSREPISAHENLLALGESKKQRTVKTHPIRRKQDHGGVCWRSSIAEWSDSVCLKPEQAGYFDSAEPSIEIDGIYV